MKKLLRTTAICIVTALAYTAPAQAEQHIASMPTAEEMEKLMALSAPSEQHNILKSIVGEWNYTITFKMAADAPEQTSTGTSTNSAILGGRFIQQNVSGMMEMDGQSHKFEGVGFLGHDNLKGEYTSIWMDNMGTGTMTGHGTYDAKTKTLNETGHFSCPMKGKKASYKSALHFVDANHYTLTMHDTNGSESYKSMEIKYTRK